jgi:prepilin-type processing-associated H-X9-DG protein
MNVAKETPPATSGPVRMQSITDGSSNTALLSEHLLAYGKMVAGGGPTTVVGGPDAKRALFETTFKVLLDQKDPIAAQAYVAACKALPGGTHPGDDGLFGAQWLPTLDFAPAINAYSHVMTPNSLSCTGAQDLSGMISNGWSGGIGAAVTATSNHPSGVNVAFCDGSVRFIKDSIDLKTWWALGSRDGKEVVSGDAY